MQSSIERIIANDRKARDAVARAEDHRRRSSDELAEKKARIAADIEEKTARHSAAVSERLKNAGTRDTEAREARAAEVCRKMNELYAEKKTEWIEKYTSEIING